MDSRISFLMLPKLKREALAVASGNEIHAYSYSGQVMRLAKRDGEVLSLTTYKGRLLDSGDYKGVRDTVTGQTVVGLNDKWRRIANLLNYTVPIWDDEKEVREETLYGAK